MNKENKPVNLLPYKIVLYTVIAILLSNIIIFSLYFLEVIKDNIYVKAFMLPIILYSVSAAAFVMPKINKYSSYRSQSNNDKYIYIISGLAFIIATITLIFSLIMYFRG
jgi:membrane protein YdbS with pleckstrin-like domain